MSNTGPGTGHDVPALAGLGPRAWNLSDTHSEWVRLHSSYKYWNLTRVDTAYSNNIVNNSELYIMSGHVAHSREMVRRKWLHRRSGSRSWLGVWSLAAKGVGLGGFTVLTPRLRM